MSTRQEMYFSVDMEASGPVPGIYSMLSLGSCLVTDPGQTFYCEIKPITKDYVPEALNISGFDMAKLEQEGVDPKQVQTI